MMAADESQDGRLAGHLLHTRHYVTDFTLSSQNHLGYMDYSIGWGMEVYNENQARKQGPRLS